MKKFFGALLLLGVYFSSIAQVSEQASSTEIYEALLKLNNTATVMYVAAHPDDENTRLISWLSNHMHVNTVYLSLTRGDGGQNLIGTEKGPLLGLLRTQELLQARSVDGGKQFFSRANDFGYSKTATETREIWEEDEIMSDVVWAIRKHRPDILINRFDHKSNGKTHGHHTFSAIASMEAFDLADKPDQFVDHQPFVQPWQVKRVFFNSYMRYYGGRENFEKIDKSNIVNVDVGEYYAIRGSSNNEIAAQSRSMHKCQGFGSAASRGRQLEYLEFLKGDAPAKTDGQMTDIFEGIDMTWNRFDGGEIIQDQMDIIINNYNFSKPSSSIPDLLQLRHLIESSSAFENDLEFKRRKINELNEIVRWCAAIYLEATTNTATVASGDSVQLTIECINRANRNVILNSVKLIPQASVISSDQTLTFNQGFEESYTIYIPENTPTTTPYWLENKQDDIGMYEVDNQHLIGLPETPTALAVNFEIQIDGHLFNFIEPIKFKYTNPAIGEIYEPLVVAPPVAMNFAEPIYILANDAPASIKVEVRSQSADVSGQIALEIAPGWQIKPPFYDFTITKKGDRETFSFDIIPPQNEEIATMKATAKIGEHSYNLSYTTVSYDHIPKQTLFLPAQAIIEHMKIIIPSMRIGYIAGAGDEIPASLRQLGIFVDEINMDNASFESLRQYQSIVIGIRAFNTQNALKYFSDDLWKYAEEGGTVIVQYNTAHRLKTDVSPIPLTLGRERITEEGAALTILEKDHLVFNYPNKIVPSDFDDWVQERGLYFASEWDDAFTPMLSGHDKGENDKKGMLLVAPYGKGYYVYTGLSFFRELPAGVPGAYRLFVNLLALQHQKP